MRRIMFVLAFMIGICLSGEAKESGLKLIPVYEKTFEDTIVDVIFDTVTVTLEEAKAMGWKEEAFSEEEKAKGESQIFYERVVVLKKGKKKEVLFYGSNGKIKKSKLTGDYAEVVISQNERYIGITTPTKWYRGEHESRFEMYDVDGNLLWQMEGLGTGPYIPSPDGRLAVGEPSIEVENAPIEIWNKKGLVKKIEKEFSGFWLSFSQDGTYMGIGIPLDYDTPKGKLIVFDKGLKTLEEDTTLAIFGDVDGGQYISFSSRKKYIVYPVIYGGIKILDLFNKSSSYINFTSKGRGNSKFYFDKNDQHLLVGYADGTCCLINLKGGEKQWEYIVNRKSRGTILTDENLNNVLIAVYPNEFCFLNSKGNVIMIQKIENINFPYIPKLNMSSDKSKIILLSKQKSVKCFKLKRR